MTKLTRFIAFILCLLWLYYILVSNPAWLMSISGYGRTGLLLAGFAVIVFVAELIDHAL